MAGEMQLQDRIFGSVSLTKTNNCIGLMIDGGNKISPKNEGSTEVLTSAIVTKVVENSVAQKAGILPNDEIYEFSEVCLRGLTAKEVSEVIANTRQKETIKIRLVRYINGIEILPENQGKKLKAIERLVPKIQEQSSIETTTSSGYSRSQDGRFKNKLLNKRQKRLVLPAHQGRSMSNISDTSTNLSYLPAAVLQLKFWLSVVEDGIQVLNMLVTNGSDLQDV